MACFISVVMATYNGEKYLRPQLDSILAQLPSDSEIIVVDDSSSDRTLEILNAYNDPRLAIIENSVNSGVVKSFSKGLRACSGEFIFLSDQDDEWENHKVETCLAKLNKYDLICHDCQVVDEEGRTLHDSYIQFRGSSVGFFKNFYKNGYIGCCMAFKRSVKEEALLYLDKSPMHDVWIGLVAEINGMEVSFIDETLLRYRRHSSVVTKSGLRDKVRIPETKSIYDRIFLAWLLFKFLLRSRISRCYA